MSQPVGMAEQTVDGENALPSPEEASQDASEQQASEAGEPEFTDVSVAIDPDDGSDQHAHFAAQRDGEPVTDAKMGDSIDLILTASDGCESAQIAGQDAPLSATSDGTQEATAVGPITGIRSTRLPPCAHASLLS